MKVQTLIMAVFIAAALFSGCSSMKFTKSINEGDEATVKSMLDKGEFGVNDEVGFGKTPIYYALLNDQDDMVRLLLEKGAKVDVRDDEGRCPLTMAAKEGKNELVKAMVKAGGNPDSKGVKGMTALMIYTERSDGLEMAKFLVENGANVNARNDRAWGKTALDMALTKDGNRQVAYYLLENGANVTEGALFSALKKDKQLAMKMIDARKTVPSSALIAVIDDDKMFDLLVQKGASPSGVVKDAARTGNLKALRKLHEEGADPNQVGNPLELAKNVETVRFLVNEMGADVNKGLPVHEAVKDEDAARIRFLVNEAGADMNKKNKQGKTALHQAAFYQKFNMLKVLLKCKGAHKINMLDNDENTVLDYIGAHDPRDGHVPDHWKSEYKGVSRKEVRKMLLDMGAKLASQL